jgi:hypothetical protein
MKTLISGIFGVAGVLILSGCLSNSAEYDKTAIGPFERYCVGYGRPGAEGLGYV